MAILGFELDEILRLVKLLETSGMEELFWEEEDRSIRIRGPRAEKPVRIVAAPVAVSESVAPRAARRPKALASGDARDTDAAKPGGLQADQIALASPMVGTFYRAEKPGAPPLVDIGQHITVGQTIGVIEAMKVFSEVPAEHAGTVVSIPVQDGQLVQPGTSLVILRRDA